MENTTLIPTVILENLDYLLLGNMQYGAPGGWLLTLIISLTAGLVASFLGLVGGLTLVLGGEKVRQILNMVIAILRAIPILMLIFWAYFLLPVLFGIDAPAFVTVVLVLALVSAAYLSQSVLSGIIAVPKDQWAAGLSLGFSHTQTLRLIILPQALRMMLPSFVNQWITLIKDSSLAYIIGVAEFTFVSTQVNNREQIYPLEIFIFLALGYFVLCSVLEWLGYRAGRRLALP